MAAQRGLFDPDGHYAALSKAGDPLERFAGGIDFELFRPELDATLDRSDGRQGGRRTRRPSGGSGKPWRGPARWRNSSPGSTRILRTPDISPGYPAMGGQIVDAAIVAVPRRRMTDAGKEIVKGIEVWKRGASRLIGRPIPGNRPRKPAQKDRDARWTLKQGRRKTRPDGTAMDAIATTVFGCKSNIDADRRHGFVRTWIVTDAARHDGRVAGGLPDQANTGSTAHRLDCPGGHGVSVAEQREENRPGQGQDRHGQHRSQHETAPVPGAQRRRGIARPRRNQIPNHTPGKGPARIAAANAL